MEKTASHWRTAAATATRNRHELAHWDLSLRHLAHRLRLIEPLARLAGAAQAETPATDAQLQEWKRQIRALDAQRDQLRGAWAELYKDIVTPQHLAIELEMRFDAEKAMIEAVSKTRKPADTQASDQGP